MAHYEAVLFDWMMTLAHYPSDADFCRTAMRSVGRAVDDAVVDRMVDALAAARAIPSVRERIALEDTSSSMHRSVNMEVFEHAGLDADLAEAFYALVGHADMHPLYPDVVGMLNEIRACGVRIAVISDIHVDLREHAERFEIAPAIDCWVLSSELGIQKPDALMFTSALDALGVTPGEALMVGDRVSRDGGAAAVGIDTLILPTNHSYAPRGLDRVARLVC